MKNRIRRVCSLGVTLCLVITFISGCVGPVGRAQQRRWVDKMNEVFKDDEFTYDGPASGELGEKSGLTYPNSKKYPHKSVGVKEVDGQLLTNYNSIRYEEAAEEYIYDYFEGKFDCDRHEITYMVRDAYGPLVDYSEKEYVKNCVTLNRVRVALVKKDGIYPSEEEMAEKLLSIAKKRDEVCDITVYYMTEASDSTNWVKESDVYYTLHMTEPRKVEYIRSYYFHHSEDNNVIVENLSW